MSWKMVNIGKVERPIDEETGGSKIENGKDSNIENSKVITNESGKEKEVDCPIKIIIDSHTHISNMNCIPKKISDIRVKETFKVANPLNKIPRTDNFFGKTEGSGGSGYLAHGSKLIMGIGKQLVSNYNKIFKKIYPELDKKIIDQNYFNINIVLPLDMEFAHYKGYLGEKLHPAVRYAMQIARIIKACKKNPWHLLPMFHYDPRRYQLSKKRENMNKKINDISKRSETQIWDAPFQYIASVASDKEKKQNESQTSIFIGFKMYTPQGYKPLDEKLKTNMLEFYKECETKNIPIIAHCNPGGNITFDWEKYFENEKETNMQKYIEQLRKTYEKKKREEDQKVKIKGNLTWSENIMSKNKIKQRQAIKKFGKEYFTELQFQYFLNEFMHPMAWIHILKDCPWLKLCLAHFGGIEVPPIKWTHRR